MRLVALAAALIAVAPVAAADAVRDVRLVGGLVASNYEADGNDVDIDEGTRLGLMGITSFGDLPALGGVVVGAELSMTMADGDDADVDTQALTVHLAYAVGTPIIDVHVEGGVFAAGTRQTVESASVDDDGTGWEWGLRAGAYWTLFGPFQIGADLRWLAASESDLDLGAGETTLENDGLVGMLSLGVRL